MSLFYVANPLEAKIRRAPVREPFSCHGRCLFSGHARFDIRQSAVDTSEALLAHQRHHGVGDARGLTRTGALNYSAAIRASVYVKARSIRARTRSLPTSAITASMAGERLPQTGDGNVRRQAYSAAMRASIYARARSMRASTRSFPTSAITASMAGERLPQTGDGNVRRQAYSAAMRDSIYAKARSIRARTRSLPTSAITASMAGDWPRPVTATRSGMPTLPMP